MYLRKYVKYGAAQRVEMNHNEDSLFMALRMDYCYVWFMTQNVWSRFQIAGGQSFFACEQQFKSNPQGSQAIWCC